AEGLEFHRGPVPPVAPHKSNGHPTGASSSRCSPKKAEEGNGDSETFPPTSSASGRRRCRATGHVEHRKGANLSDAASAPHRRIRPQWCYRHYGALGRTMAVGASRSTVYRRE